MASENRGTALHGRGYTRARPKRIRGAEGGGMRRLLWVSLLVVLSTAITGPAAHAAFPYLAGSDPTTTGSTACAHPIRGPAS